MGIIKAIVLFISDLIMVIPIILVACIARFWNKSIDIGLGPEPMINNVHHKKALQQYGYSAETFVRNVYFITNEFDIRADLIFKSIFRLFISYYLFILSVFRYKCVYIYFSGGPLGFTSFLWRLEPYLYRVSRTHVVIMPYGGDIHDMSLSPNLLFKNAMSQDYPKHKNRRKKIHDKIDIWTKGADHIIAGCDWVYYLYYWDTLMLAHFSIDTERWKAVDETRISAYSDNKPTPLRILHAPNHTSIKGSRYFIQAVEELKQEGVEIDLLLVQKIPNEEISKLMGQVDLVADQLIIGWYAMFALEAMAMEKPVLCYINNELEEFYINAGLLQPDELPIIKCAPSNLKETLRRLAGDKHLLGQTGIKSRQYVIKHHSLNAVGSIFDKINRSIGVK